MERSGQQGRMLTILVLATLVSFSHSIFVSSSAQSWAADTATANASASATASDTSFVPTQFAPQLTVNQFLIVSSSTTGKILYTALKNFKSVTGNMQTLVESGLVNPSGIAVDTQNGLLYVADPGQNSVFRYKLLVSPVSNRDGDRGYILATDNTRLTVASGHPCEYVAVDTSGNVFYSTTDTKSVNKITPGTLAAITSGVADPSTLAVKDEGSLEAAASAAMTALVNGIVVPKSNEAAILAYYQGGVSPNVDTPGGLFSDGIRLWWTNLASGTKVGSVIRGQVVPTAPTNAQSGASSPGHFVTTSLANISDVNYGMTATNSLLIWAASGGLVYGATQSGTGTPVAMVQGLSEPRGIVWDQDNTAYVADVESGKVWSFPTGRLIASVPITISAVSPGAFGVALLSQNDAGWQYSGGMPSVGRIHGVVFVAVVMRLLSQVGFM